MVEESHGYVTGAGGLRLFYRAREIAGSRGRALVLHGLGEHSGRYGRLADFLNREGYDVYALDLRGHGRSQGRRGHVRCFEHMLQDVDRLRRRVCQQADGARATFVFGHSLGGLVAGRYVQEFCVPDLCGAILVAPFLRLEMELPGWKVRLGKVADRVAPALTLDNGLRETVLFREAGEREAYRVDPLVHRRISARLWAEMLRNAERFAARAADVRTPLLFQLPGDDRVVSSAASREAARCFSSAVEVREYPASFHALYHDPDAATGLTDLTRWLEHRLAERTPIVRE